MTRIEEYREKAMLKLREQLELAIDRLKQSRVAHPEGDVYEGQFYVDGSYRYEFNTNPLYPPDNRVWVVGYLKGYTVFLYEKVNEELYRSKGIVSDFTEVDLGEYGLVVSVPSPSPSWHSGPDLVRVSDEKLLHGADWSLEHIIEMIELLEGFFIEGDLAERITTHAAA